METGAAGCGSAESVKCHGAAMLVTAEYADELAEGNEAEDFNPVAESDLLATCSSCGWSCIKFLQTMTTLL